MKAPVSDRSPFPKFLELLGSETAGRMFQQFCSENNHNETGILQMLEGNAPPDRDLLLHLLNHMLPVATYHKHHSPVSWEQRDAIVREINAAHRAAVASGVITSLDTPRTGGRGGVPPRRGRAGLIPKRRGGLPSSWGEALVPKTRELAEPVHMAYTPTLTADSSAKARYSEAYRHCMMYQYADNISPEELKKQVLLLGGTVNTSVAEDDYRRMPMDIMLSVLQHFGVDAENLRQLALSAQAAMQEDGVACANLATREALQKAVRVYASAPPESDRSR